VQAPEHAVAFDHVAVGGHRVELCQGVDIVAGDEGLAARAGDDHRACCVVAQRVVERRVEQCQQAGGERVELVRAIDGQQPRGADLLAQQHRR
jgi:hypothetical protein